MSVLICITKFLKTTHFKKKTTHIMKKYDYDKTYSSHNFLGIFTRIKK